MSEGRPHRPARTGGVSRRRIRARRSPTPAASRPPTLAAGVRRCEAWLPLAAGLFIVASLAAPVATRAQQGTPGDTTAHPGAGRARPPGLETMSSPAPPFPESGMDTSGTVWIDSRPLTWKKLRGEVVLIDFMEYTCINCIRTFDDNLRLWKRYHDRGFEIIGIHAPEFHFAYDVDNVRRAVGRFALPYPVVVDDWFRLWKAYGSHTWPNRFLVDATGTVRYHKAGEGADAALERAIRKLLTEAHPGMTFPDSMTIPPPRDAFADSCGRTTPEVYVGVWHGRGALANDAWYRPGKVTDYELPDGLSDGRVALRGPWETDTNGMIYRGTQSVGTARPDQLSLVYTARELYSVVNVARAREPERVYLSQDGHWLGKEEAGVDVRFDQEGRSYLYVDEPRMYYLVANPGMGQHLVNLLPTAPGLMVNSFTFGNDCQTDFSHR